MIERDNVTYKQSVIFFETTIIFKEDENHTGEENHSEK